MIASLLFLAAFQNVPFQNAAKEDFPPPAAGCCVELTQSFLEIASVGAGYADYQFYVTSWADFASRVEVQWDDGPVRTYEPPLDGGCDSNDGFGFGLGLRRVNLSPGFHSVEVRVWSCAAAADDPPDLVLTDEAVIP